MIWDRWRSSGISLDRLGSRTGQGCGSSSVDVAAAGSLRLGVPLLQANSPWAGAAGGSRLTGTRLPVLTRDTQHHDQAKACCEIS